jgi:hypothetical protein
VVNHSFDLTLMSIAQRYVSSMATSRALHPSFETKLGLDQRGGLLKIDGATKLDMSISNGAAAGHAAYGKFLFHPRNSRRLMPPCTYRSNRFRSSCRQGNQATELGTTICADAYRGLQRRSDRPDRRSTAMRRPRSRPLDQQLYGDHPVGPRDAAKSNEAPPQTDEVYRLARVV